MPDHILHALEHGGPEAAAVGLTLARELIQAIRETVAGIYVIPPFKQPEAALDLFVD